MRTLVAAVFGISTSLALGQDILEQQSAALKLLPAISYIETQRCVKPGDALTTAKVKFGDPVSGTNSTSLSGTKLMSFRWPEAGIYRIFNINLFGKSYVSSMKGMTDESFDYFDGNQSYAVYRSGRQDQVNIEDGLSHRGTVIVIDCFGVMGQDPTSLTQTSTSIDPNFGKLIHFKGNNLEFDISPDRDFMTVYSKSQALETWVLKTEQFGGRWIPTSIKQTNSVDSPVDIFIEIANVKPLEKINQVFKPHIKPGSLVVKDGTYFEIDSAGKLTKSKSQPDRTSEYLTWAGVGALAILILSVIVIGSYKLIRKQN